VPRITVVGSANIDLVARCERLPRAGETVTDATFDRVAGGKGANQAVAAARLAASVAMFGRVGADAAGRALLASLRQDAIDCAGVGIDPGLPTGRALVLVDQAGDNQIVVLPGANAAVGGAEARGAADAARGGVLVTQLEIPLAVAAAAIERAAGTSCVVLNAAPATRLPASCWRRWTCWWSTPRRRASWPAGPDPRPSWRPRWPSWGRRR
jgi:ribokinase